MPKQMEVMSLRMDKALHGKLNRAAERKGLPLSALIRMWLIERLEHEADEERRKSAAR